MDLIQECQYDHRCLRIGIDGCAVHVRPSMGGETSAEAVERLRTIIGGWHQEQVVNLQARVAELEVDRWLVEHVGFAPRGLARSNCPPDTYGTADALCHEPPIECPGTVHCYRAWAVRQIAAEREKEASDRG